MTFRSRVEPHEPPAHLDHYAHAVIGAAIEVHRTLGPGFLESVYEEALKVELNLRRIPHETQFPLAIEYKGVEVAQSRLDLLVEGELVVELKAVDLLVPVHTAQLLSYLKAGGFQLGLLINFNVPILKNGIKRVIYSG
ncbi:MAG: uncharacterized protein JWO36_4807 [Myxococcales bacterium]|nr:uncharacterized protein [Myxococcales bacterium]